MNRQERRRAEREGKKGPQWDIIIPSILVVAVLLIFLGNYLFPNLNLSTYADAPPRVLRKIGDRGIARLRQDWPGIKSFSYGSFANDEESTWLTYTVEKKDDTWAFTDLEDEKTVDYATNNLPELYVDLPEVLDNLAAALHSKDFSLVYQQTTGDMNVFTATKLVNKEEQKLEQYSLVFDKDHNLARIIYLNTLEEQITGYAFADLYKAQPEPESGE